MYSSNKEGGAHTNLFEFKTFPRLDNKIGEETLTYTGRFRYHDRCINQFLEQIFEGS